MCYNKGTNEREVMTYDGLLNQSVRPAPAQLQEVR